MAFWISELEIKGLWQKTNLVWPGFTNSNNSLPFALPLGAMRGQSSPIPVRVGVEKCSKLQIRRILHCGVTC